MTPEARLRELLENIDFAAKGIRSTPTGAESCIRTDVAEALSLLGQMGGERTEREWKAGDVVAEYKNGYGVLTRIQFDAEGHLVKEYDQGDHWACANNAEVAEAANLLRIPLTLPKPEKPAYGPESEPLTVEEFAIVKEGMSFLFELTSGYHTVVARTDTITGARESAFMGEWNNGGICSWDHLRELRPATIETAIALNRLPAPTEAVAEGEKGALDPWREIHLALDAMHDYGDTAHLERVANIRTWVDAITFNGGSQ